MIDAGAYFSRIGFDGGLCADREAIDALILRHTRTIAFENLDALSGIDPPFEDSALMEKLVRHRRGGWCFEHNHLLGAVLRRHGIDVTALAARVLWGRSGPRRPARGHMLLAIRLGDDTRIADAGFGVLSPTATLSLGTTRAQSTPHERFRVLPDAEGYRLEVELDGAWQALYAFDLQPQHASDYRVTSWYLANHPDSPFRRRLMLARPLANGRATLLDDRLTVREPDETQVTRVEDVPTLEHVLKEVFGIHLGESPSVRRRLAERAHARDRPP